MIVVIKDTMVNTGNQWSVATLSFAAFVCLHIIVFIQLY